MHNDPETFSILVFLFGALQTKIAAFSLDMEMFCMSTQAGRSVKNVITRKRNHAFHSFDVPVVCKTKKKMRQLILDNVFAFLKKIARLF